MSASDAFLTSLHSGISVFTCPRHAIQPHSQMQPPHPHLLVPEEQLAACFVQLQPVDLAVVADGASVVATNEVHLGRKEREGVST